MVTRHVERIMIPCHRLSGALTSAKEFLETQSVTSAGSFSMLHSLVEVSYPPTFHRGCDSASRKSRYT